MAVVRCAARRLGGSLLQRAQAAVAGKEGRRLGPGRFMRSRHLSSECAREIQDKKLELRNLIAKALNKKEELHGALSKAAKNSEAIGEPDLRLLERFSLRKVAPKPHKAPSTWRRIAARANGLLEAAANVTVFVLATAFAIGGRFSKGAKGETVGEENQ
ncbi:uncharacterized protein LOC119349839 [Triticum dicoccoides]|uniref:uncharacterized protein LOC119313934 n=1 Tax=Triticum dicoccoides TaxID=85692 RepID=UPI0018907CF9|nr:uncharacterized protein LOC119313934 [Triticum dicoccoides]XP_037473830.1 uncharacterized protein LOC119349839 [Triticum dicoccoides]